MKARIFKGDNNEWYWHIVAKNGQIIADGGEGYKTRWGCKRAVKKFLGL